MFTSLDLSGFDTSSCVPVDEAKEDYSYRWEGMLNLDDTAEEYEYIGEEEASEGAEWNCRTLILGDKFTLTGADTGLPTPAVSDQYTGYWTDGSGKYAGSEIPAGQALRFEGIRIATCQNKYQGGIRYRTHVQNEGWQEYVVDGELAGTSGQALRLEAIEIELYGEIEKYYDVYYRVHVQNIGWTDWVKNGELAGTEGKALRLEGIEIKLVEKQEL